MSLRTILTQFVDAVASKVNTLDTVTEKKANKKQDLTSTATKDYPSVPAVKAGLATILQEAKDHAEGITPTLPEHIVIDEFYVHTDENFTTPEKNKLAGLEDPKYKGLFTSLANLQAAYPVGEEGWKADVDNGTTTVSYAWDTDTSTWEETSAPAGETASSIKQKYESNTNTNAFTDSYKGEVDDNTLHRGKTDNPHSVTKAQVGLGNVNNTSDADKPVSTLQGAAIDEVQVDLDNYKQEVGENFPDYAAQFNAAVNF